MEKSTNAETESNLGGFIHKFVKHTSGKKEKKFTQLSPSVFLFENKTLLGPGQGSHGIPGGKGLGFEVEDVEDLLGDEGAVDDDLVDELLEPVVGHHDVTLLVPILAPGILHSPLRGGVTLLEWKRIISFLGSLGP